MKATVQLEWTDYLAALRLSGRQTLNSLGVFFVLAALFGCYLFARGAQATQRDQATLQTFLPLLLLLLYLLFEYVVLLPRGAKKLFQQTHEVQLPLEVEVTPEGLRATSAVSTVLWPWDRFSVAMETRQIFWLFDADSSQLLLPKRALPEGLLAQLRAKLSSVKRQTRVGPNSALRGTVIFLISLATLAMLMFQLVQPVP